MRVRTSEEVDFILPEKVWLSITQLEEEIRWAHQTQPLPPDCPKGRVFVLESHIKMILQYWLFCHPGINKTLAELRAHFWWRNRVTCVKEFV